MTPIFPRIIYFALFFIPILLYNYDKLSLGLANSLLAISFEDISYWIWAKQLPYQWSYYYPVIYHIPIVDLIEFYLAYLLYRRVYHV